MKTDYDVLIVGGGMVGASLACALEPLKLKVGIIEAKPPQVNTSQKKAHKENNQPNKKDLDIRSITLSYGSYRIFETMGVWQHLCDHALAIKKVHVTEQGKFGSCQFDTEKENTDAFGYVVEAHQLVNSLSLASQQYVDWIAPAKVIAVESSQECATVSVEHLESSKQQTISAKLIVAADGTNSTIRKLLKIECRQWTYPQVAVIANVAHAKHHQQVAYERFTSNGPIALLPNKEKISGLVWCAPEQQASRLLDLPDAKFLIELQKQFGYRLGRFEAVSKRMKFPLQMLQATQQVQHRIALVGNAAHTLHPISAQGFNLGLRDVAVMAQVIADAVVANKDYGDLKVLEKYFAWRSSDQQQMIAFTDGLNRLYSNKLPPLALLRNFSLLAIELIGPLKQFLMKRTMGVAGRLPNLACGLPLISEEQA